ncbi:MAG: hypothetical protein ACK4UJ_00635 [Leptonema sp. (in: bacteria)]
MIKKSNLKLFILFFSILFCSKEVEKAQLQTLINNQLGHTHEIQITFEDLDTEITDYYTSENFGHVHKVILTKEDKSKLKFGISLIKECEFNWNHTHTLEIELLKP